MDTIANVVQEAVHERDHALSIFSKMNDMKLKTRTLNTRTGLTMDDIQMTINAFLDNDITRQETLDDITQDFESLFRDAIDLIQQHNEISDQLDDILRNAHIDTNKVLGALLTIASDLDIVFRQIEQLCTTATHTIADETLDSQELQKRCQQLRNFRNRNIII
jgi:hypothetical protein